MLPSAPLAAIRPRSGSMDCYDASKDKRLRALSPYLVPLTLDDYIRAVSHRVFIPAHGAEPLLRFSNMLPALLLIVSREDPRAVGQAAHLYVVKKNTGHLFALPFFALLDCSAA
jgi:hypothetical protein